MGSVKESIAKGIRDEKPSKIFALFSGGHDSLCSTDIAADYERFAGVIHIHTGIGIPETREYVHDTCADKGWTLHEVTPEAQYEDLVLERGGFPHGPASHNSMLWHLKQKPLRAFLQTQKVKYHDRIGLVSGIRKEESTRRMGKAISQPVYRWKIQLWLNPILDWTRLDCNRYIEEQNLPRNEVANLLCRSGECLCGALSQRKELVEIERWYPEVAQRIHDLEERAEDAGLKAHLWAQRQWKEPRKSKSSGEPLCASCEARAE